MFILKENVHHFLSMSFKIFDCKNVKTNYNVLAERMIDCHLGLETFQLVAFLAVTSVLLFYILLYRVKISMRVPVILPFIIKKRYTS